MFAMKDHIMDFEDETKSGSGAQAVERTVALLRLVASSGSRGMRLLELTEASRLARPTVHRILKALQSEGLVQQEASTKHYRLGPTMYEFGLAAPSPIERLDDLRPVLRELASATEDTAYLVIRNGDEAICLAIEEGAYPIRARTFEIGARRPLGMGAAGLALLAALPNERTNDLIARKGHTLEKVGITSASLRKRVELTRSAGFALSEGTITDGVTGLAVVLPDEIGAPYLAVSVAAISARMPKPRHSELVSHLKQAANGLSKRVLKTGGRGLGGISPPANS